MDKLKTYKNELPLSALNKWQPTLKAEVSSGYEIDILDVVGEDLWTGGITTQTVSKQLKEIGNNDVTVYINSPGGSIYAGLAILDTMQMIRNPISTVAVGVTASFGTVLLAGGTKGQRYALPHATIHLHQPLGGAEGQASDIEIMAREVLRLKAELNQFFSNVTGQPLDVIQRDTDRDFYMTAEQAVTYGLIDKVLQPPVKSGSPA